ncbi:hypothetical protein SAMN04489760_1463 [Syntrophus gentianae]|uniref:Uncharacterized protein n=1 Tax=Syntrophus gentianae TaxID=43775 RepID=A0A1H8B441_9BACT|nr:hypothetical protein SAMN04489760_1463 [Syntrophus gentianae]
MGRIFSRPAPPFQGEVNRGNFFRDARLMAARFPLGLSCTERYKFVFNRRIGKSACQPPLLHVENRQAKMTTLSLAV